MWVGLYCSLVATKVENPQMDISCKYTNHDPKFHSTRALSAKTPSEFISQQFHALGYVAASRAAVALLRRKCKHTSTKLPSEILLTCPTCDIIVGVTGCSGGLLLERGRVLLLQGSQMWGRAHPSWMIHFEDMENKEIAEIRPETAALSESPPWLNPTVQALASALNRHKYFPLMQTKKLKQMPWQWESRGSEAMIIPHNLNACCF